MSFSSLPINQMQTVNDLSRYVIGAEINQQGESSGVVSGTALMAGISGGTWLFSNRKDLKGGFANLSKAAKEGKQIITSTKKVASGKPFSRVRNLWAGAGEYTAKSSLTSMSAQMAKSPEYAGISKFINQSMKSGKNYSEILKDAEKMKAVANLNKYNTKVATQMANGSVLRSVKNGLGITKTSKAIKSFAAKSPKFASLLKGVKGNAAFAAISFGLGVVTDVLPAFQLGTDKGFKQLGKTAVKTAAEVGGWAAGTALGAKAGAVAGTFIGGPIGAAVGGVIGAACGFLGSFLASKAADAVVGPSEVELAENEAASEITTSAMTEENGANELAQATYQRLVETAATGELSEDDLKAKKQLETLIGQEIDLDAAVQQYKSEQAAQTGTAQSQEQAPAQTGTTQEDTTSQQQAEAAQAQLAAQMQQAQSEQLASASTDNEQETAAAEEEAQGKKDKDKTKTQQYQFQTGYAYQSPLSNPFLSTSNPYSMTNPYGFASTELSNPYTASINPYSSGVQQDTATFKYNPNIN